MLKVFRGADGEFSLYEDDGVSLDYLDGDFTWTQIRFENENGRLILEPGGGNPPSEERIIRVELLPDEKVTSVTYRGERMEVSLW